MYLGMPLSSQDRCKNKTIKNMDLLEEYYIPLDGHLAIPIGERVAEGQLLVCDNKDNQLIHSPITGLIHDEQIYHKKKYVVIKTDLSAPQKKYLLDEPFQKSVEELIEKIRLAGIVELESGELTYKRIQEAVGNVTTIVINGLETDLFLAVNYRLLYEKTKEIIQTAQVLRSMIKAQDIVIAFVQNKQLKSIIEQFIFDETISILECPAVYPNAYEKFLVYQITDQKLSKNKSSVVAKCIVFSISTLYAIYEAIFYDKPLMDRVITVDGAYCLEYGNFRVKVGTPLARFMRPFSVENTYVMFQGGPMKGHALVTEKSITKTMSSVMIFEGQLDPIEQECIYCGACVSICPTKLEPFKLVDYIRHQEYEKVFDLDIEECIACNLCSYVCPSYIPLGKIITTENNCVEEI